MKKLLQKSEYKIGNRGYTLLFSILVATIVLGVAIFIIDVSRKQYELSVAARNSIYSFYAADSGIECAVSGANWAISSGFSSTTPNTLTCASGVMNTTLVSPSIYPPGILIADPLDPVGNPVRQQSGYISLNYVPGGNTIKQCAEITITTGFSPRSNEPTTIIDSRGYNLCVDNPSVLPDISNPGTVERALRLTQTGAW